MRLRYHRLAFKLLGESPVISPAALKLIEDWEGLHSRKMPKSVREWYSLEGADVRLTLESDEYYQRPLAWCLGVIGEEEAKFLAESHGRPDLLPFMLVLGIRREVHFHVRLHGPEDPFVFDDVDPDRTNVPFSEFILDTLNDIAEAIERDQA